MEGASDMSAITDLETLESIYGQPREAATVKEIGRIIPEYRAYIEASPFVALATVGPEGLDCSPRGDRPGFVRVRDEKTLLLPDRHGNNRIDSLRNIVRDPRVAVLFLIPGSANTLRVNGRAHVTAEAALLDSFEVEGKSPRTVTVIKVDAVYFQCGRAIVRSELWNPDHHVAPDALPTAGEMLAAISGGRVGGETYDREWPERARKTLW